MNVHIEVDVTREEFEQAKQRAIDKALSTLRTPISGVPVDYEVEIIRTGQEVLDCENLTAEEAMQQPWLLLSGDAYNGGATTAMDPFHAATPALNELRFAGSGAVRDNRPELMRTAVDRAEGFIRGEGVPDEVGVIRPGADRARSFEALDILTLMPQVMPRTPYWEQVNVWEERAEAAYLLMGARLNVPTEHPARVAVDEYVSLLANPEVPSVLLEPPANAVYDALSQ